MIRKKKILNMLEECIKVNFFKDNNLVESVVFSLFHMLFRLSKTFVSLVLLLSLFLPLFL